MITYRRWSLRRSVQRTFGLATATVLVWSAFVTTGVFAQQETVIIGGSGLPEIEINLDVLDLLGAAPSPASPLLAPDTRPAVFGFEPAGTVERTPLVEPSPPVVAKKVAVPAPAPPVKPEIAAPSIAVPAVTAAVAPREAPPPPSPKPALQIAPKAAEPAAPAAPQPAKDETKAATAPQPVKAPDPAVADPPEKSPAVATPAPPPEPPGMKPTVEPATVAASTPAETKTPEPAVTPEPAAAPAPTMPEPAAGPDTEDAAKVAALSADESGDAKVSGPIRIEFEGDSTRLPEESWNDLRVFARQLLGSDSLRAQVKAFAGDSSASESSARRLSLSRALAVRAFLIERGVRSTRIDVRAMGKQSEGGPSERVDVVLVDR